MTDMEKTKTNVMKYYERMSVKVPFEINLLSSSLTLNSRVYFGPNDPDQGGNIDGNDNDPEEVITFKRNMPLIHSKDDGNIDGNEPSKEEVIKFILNPKNSYLFGSLEHISKSNDMIRLIRKNKHIS